MGIIEEEIIKKKKSLSSPKQLVTFHRYVS